MPLAQSSRALWARLPVLVRAPLAAFVVLSVGSTVGVFPLLGNLRLHPEIPWALPATGIVMAAFWFYFSGSGPPIATRAMRQSVSRRGSLAWPIWRAAILPVLLSVVTVSSLRLALPSVLPMEAGKVAIDLSPYSLATALGLLLSIAVCAGIAEELAFRGYLQKSLEDAYGIVPALALTGVAFWLAHTDKVTLTHLPFHLVASILLGLLAYLTKSLWPSILAHGLGDALLQPAYAFGKPAFAFTALTAQPVWSGLANATLGERLERVGHALAPSALLGSGPESVFAVAAWVFFLSAGLTIIVFARLSRRVAALRENAEAEPR